MFHLKNYINIISSGILLVIIFSFQLSFTSAQTKTNLQVFYNLADSSVSNINQKLSTPDIKISFSSGSYFIVFNNQVIADFAKLGRIILSDSNKSVSNVTSISYLIDNASVKYGDMERDGFFGNFIMPRKIEISGSYSLNKGTINSERFNYIYNDTVSVDDLRTIENPSFPFTQSEVPSEPFLSGLFEPAVAIGSAALAVILFFTVRSK